MNGDKTLTIDRPHFTYMTAAIAATLALGLASVAAQDRSQTRSMVISQLGVVATEQPLAAEAGAAILEPRF